MTSANPFESDQESADCEQAAQAVLLEQFTQSLEESAWLRRLASHFEFRDVRHSVTQVAEELLPELRRIILAESVALIPSKHPNEHGSVPSGSWNDAPVWIGPELPDDCLARVLEHCGEEARRQAVVRNEDGVGNHAVSIEGVDAFILVHVGASDRDIGWLIAINRDLSVQSDSCSASPAAEWETEFGSVESSLVEAAAGMLSTHACNVALFEEKERLLIGVIAAMSRAVDARDPYTRGHSERVAAYARIIASELGLAVAECERIHVAGLLHDIGKIGVPDAILKKQGKLTDAEFKVIQQHPEQGYQILHELEELAYTLPGVLHHHERMDGAGYPHGLRGNEIPLMARILAVADSYDAMTSSRTYRAAMPSSDAEEILQRHAGSQWDDGVVAAFFRRADQIRRLVGKQGLVAGAQCDASQLNHADATSH